MNDLKKQATYSNGRENRLPCHKSLPGQRLLFTDDDLLNGASEELAENQHRELFYTGRDLPGAKETLQAILWDIKIDPAELLVRKLKSPPTRQRLPPRSMESVPTVLPPLHGPILLREDTADHYSTCRTREGAGWQRF